ncbi:peptide chain release factor N(5)-glutamine methyltransferase [Mycoplasmopsis agassizii]|uniref:peptide chain release factor N(5)-glutamine methyltransferase n=1 Tax=Mycoplasmopsis agassizii TaxID=33922 RepID=A0ABX4H557_9BACT|nr:peptide chain release factor N(5)-glutamine methyltransferase [Mycoplasmopsis agassizii]PAF55026.1 hypothetical protein CJF60_04825 [Mycoplasmopsis agassizii]SMC17515.1 release factor glutamine methyltransferase [Mycoplasmopsis agassizii]
MDRRQLLLLEKRRYQLEEKISEKELKMLEDNVPIQKIIGYLEMANVTINLDHHVLIPRYETEELILLIKEKIKTLNSILEIGTGSGFIALALAKIYFNALIDAVDISDEAIKQSQKNSLLNDIKNVHFFKSNVFENVSKTYDLIVANPPYLILEDIPDKTILDHEPEVALIAKDDGLDVYKKILKDYDKYLNKGGWLFFEINHRHSNFFVKFNFKTVKDINGKIRFAYYQKGADA